MPIPTLRKWLGIEIVETSLTEKLVAAAGGGLSIMVLIYLCLQVLPGEGAAQVIGSMGASAVLLFAVPHGPLSQPWPVIAGHTFSAAIGVACARWIHAPAVAAACAVGLAIGAMHQLKCIHPPGGATAFAAVMGGNAVRGLGFGFVLFPVLANALIMVLLAVIINGCFKWRRYPAVLSRPSRPAKPSSSSQPTHSEVVAAIRSLDSFVDISEQDLLHLVETLSRHPAYRGSQGKREQPALREKVRVS
ncbi:MAG: hypothetical protein EOP86_14195 [Verrucomicrobiaceae bacterium]|nr:MAG: hypothetical protein EOP86_14195 [Verrucomicrobiaceae bacterium]